MSKSFYFSKKFCELQIQAKEAGLLDIFLSEADAKIELKQDVDPLNMMEEVISQMLNLDLKFILMLGAKEIDQAGNQTIYLFGGAYSAAIEHRVGRKVASARLKIQGLGPFDKETELSEQFQQLARLVELQDSLLTKKMFNSDEIPGYLGLTQSGSGIWHAHLRVCRHPSHDKWHQILVRTDGRHTPAEALELLYDTIAINGLQPLDHG